MSVRAALHEALWYRSLYMVKESPNVLMVAHKQKSLFIRRDAVFVTLPAVAGEVKAAEMAPLRGLTAGRALHLRLQRVPDAPAESGDPALSTRNTKKLGEETLLTCRRRGGRRGGRSGR